MLVSLDWVLQCTPPSLHTFPVQRHRLYSRSLSRGLTDLTWPAESTQSWGLEQLQSWQITLLAPHNLSGSNQRSVWLPSIITARDAAPCVILLWKAWGDGEWRDDRGREQCRTEHMVRLSTQAETEESTQHITSPSVVPWCWQASPVMLCHCVMLCYPITGTKGKHLGIETGKCGAAPQPHNNDIL